MISMSSARGQIPRRRMPSRGASLSKAPAHAAGIEIQEEKWYEPLKRVLTNERRAEIEQSGNQVLLHNRVTFWTRPTLSRPHDWRLVSGTNRRTASNLSFRSRPFHLGTLASLNHRRLNNRIGALIPQTKNHPKWNDVSRQPTNGTEQEPRFCFVRSVVCAPASLGVVVIAL